MPTFRHHTVFKVARNIEAFLKLEAGLARATQKKKKADAPTRGSQRPERTSEAPPETAEAKPAEQMPLPSGGSEALYLDLMKRCLTNWIYMDAGKLSRRDKPFDPNIRTEGRDWPSNAHTMIGLKRLGNLQFCVEDALANDVPGDLIETGVWRGGATIFMRAILKAHDVTDRRVWVADSFEGLPEPEPEKYPADEGDTHHRLKDLAISLEQVESNFKRYGLLDDQVRFLKGWFDDTLPEAPIEKLAVARLDGDMYGSTMDALVNLYPKLSVGGYLIVDDYSAVPGCRQAVHDYRKAHSIEEEIVRIDAAGAFWRRAE